MHPADTPMLTSEPRDPSLVHETWTYTISVRFDEDSDAYTARCEELPGLFATGETETAAVEAVSDLIVQRHERRLAESQATEAR